MNINTEQDQADNTQNLEEFKSTVKAWVSEPVKSLLMENLMK